MPRYRYKCKECQSDFETVHLMSEKFTDCNKCKSKDSLERIPFLMRSKKGRKSKTGDVVKKFIKDTKEDINIEKRELTKDYEP